MKAVEHITNNRIIGAPVDWDHSRAACPGLPVTDREMFGLPVMVSFWKPTEEEIEALKAGAMIALTVVGAVHPPVGMHIEGE